MITFETIRPRLVLATTAGDLHHLGDRDGWVYRTVCGVTIELDPVGGIAEPVPAGGDLRNVVTCPRCKREMR